MMSVKLQFRDPDIRNPQSDVPSSIFFLCFQIRNPQFAIRNSICYPLFTVSRLLTMFQRNELYELYEPNKPNELNEL